MGPTFLRRADFAGLTGGYAELYRQRRRLLDLAAAEIRHEVNEIGLGLPLDVAATWENLHAKGLPLLSYGEIAKFNEVLNEAFGVEVFRTRYGERGPRTGIDHVAAWRCFRAAHPEVWLRVLAVAREVLANAQKQAARRGQDPREARISGAAVVGWYRGRYGPLNGRFAAGIARDLLKVREFNGRVRTRHLPRDEGDGWSPPVAS